MTKRRRKNPQIGPLQVLARARDLLLDPNPGSLTVLLDMLEENDTTLAALSRQFAATIPFNMAHEMTERDGTGRDEGYFELERNDSVSQNNRVGVAWTMKPYHKPRIWINWRGILWSESSDGATLPLEIGRGDGRAYGHVHGVWFDSTKSVESPLVRGARDGDQPPSGVLYDLVLVAWRATVLLKDLLSQYGLTAIGVMDSLHENMPWSPHYLIDPPAHVVMNTASPHSTLIHKNPAGDMTEAAFATEARRLLLDRDPDSTTILQDMLMDRGMTLAELGALEIGTSEKLLELALKEGSPDPMPDTIGAFEVTAPKQGVATSEYTLPTHWASMLINGDTSGMTDDEVADIDSWLLRVKPGHAVNVGDESWFTHGHDANRNQGAEVATFTFASYYPADPEGVVWMVLPTSTGKKFIAWVTAYYRNQSTLLYPGRRYVTVEEANAAGALWAWKVVIILKGLRDETDPKVVHAKLSAASAAPDSPHYIPVPEELADKTLIGPGDMKPRENPRRARGVEEQVAWNRIREKFIELLQDPDPNALDAARDLLLENNVKLADVAHLLALNGASNWAFPTKGWVGDFPSGNTGELVLHGAVDADSFTAKSVVDDPDYTAVAWSIWKTRVRKGHPGVGDSASPHAFTSEIQVNYRGHQWIESRNGVQGLTIAGNQPPLGDFGGSTLEIAERRTIDMAWKICRVIKMLDGAPPAQIQIACRELTTPKTPPMLINPPRRGIARARQLRANPPWVTHALADAFESLSSQVEPQWMPRLEDVRGGPRGTLVASIKEYGCGAYGCVMPTQDGSVVLKVTTDETEADFATKLAADLVRPICVEYYMAVSLAARHEGRPIYLLWRESADEVGDVEEVLGKDAGFAVEHQHQIAQQIYLALHEKNFAMAKQLFPRWEDACEAMGAAAPELETLAAGVLEVYRKQHVFFGDIHAGNLGRVFRGGDAGEWVITDPGHVAVLS